jgi:hypothetical protein
VFFTGDGTVSAPFVSTFSGTVPGTTGSLQVNGAGALMGLNAMALDDGTSGSFDTGAPPAVAPAGAAVQLGTYGSGGSAAIGTPGQSVMFGFPFETLVGQPTRVEVMRRVLAFLSPAGFDGGLVQVDAGLVLDGGVVLDAGMNVPDAGADDAGMNVPDAGADDAGTTGDAGRDAGTGSDAGGTAPAPGLEGTPCLSDVDCAAPLLCRRGPLVPRCGPAPVLAFQGGGCSSAPLLVPLLALLVLRRRRNRVTRPAL